MIKVATSGYFDPLHVGHISCFEEAKSLGWLIVIVNNDEQAIKKKGYYFMPLEERMKIISSLRCVDEVIASIDTDELVCETLRLVRPNILAKGGEWNKENTPPRTVEVCREIGCIISFGLGETPVVHSSSKIIERAMRLYGYNKNPIPY